MRPPALEASAPLRADLAGGTLDIWPLYLLHEGSVTVNLALSIRARAAYQPDSRRWRLVAADRDARRSVAAGGLSEAARRSRAGDPFALLLRALAWAGVESPGRVETRVEGPAAAGLGGSSALLIACLGLAVRLADRDPSAERLAPLARDLECQVLGFPTGEQDYHPALFGGVQELAHGPGGTRGRHLDVDPTALSSRLIIAHGGTSHESAPSNWQLLRGRLDGERAYRVGFDAIAAAAREASAALRDADWPRLAAAVDADWRARKLMEPGLAPPALRRLEEVGRAAGADAAKGCGAASGGCMLFVVREPQRRQPVEEALRESGASLLPSRVESSGLTVDAVRRRPVSEGGAET